MGILLEVVIVLGVIGFIVAQFVGRRKEAEREVLLERRVAAYMQTIRREKKHPELLAMNDNELGDLLLSSARNLRVQSERRWQLTVGGVVLALVAAIMVATEEGMRGFGIALLVGALVIYGLNEFAGRRMREPMIARGIDVDRLRVE